MARETVTRSAADNVYLHKDFHGALSAGIAYLESRYGAEAVRSYVRRFTVKYYAPLVQAIKDRGLSALRDHLQRIYALEGGRIKIDFAEEEMTLEVEECPAVAHMRAHGYPVAPLFHETSKTLYAALCEGTPFVSEWLRYDARTGRSAVRFRRSAP